MSHSTYILEIETVNDLTRVYNWLAAGQPQKVEGKVAVPESAAVPEVARYFPGVVFKSVAIDTLTEYHNMALDKITGNIDKAVGAAQVQPQIQHWGELLRQTSFLVRSFYDLPIHVFITVQSAEQQDGSTGATLHRPQLWGKSVKEVPAYAYIHTYVVQAQRLTALTRKQMKLPQDLDLNTRVALFTPRFDSMAKDQYGLLGPHMVEPTIGKICEAIYQPA